MCFNYQLSANSGKGFQRPGSTRGISIKFQLFAGLYQNTNVYAKIICSNLIFKRVSLILLVDCPVDIWRNNNVIITSQRRFGAIMTLLLHHESAGYWYRPTDLLEYVGCRCFEKKNNTKPSAITMLNCLVSGVMNAPHISRYKLFNALSSGLGQVDGRAQPVVLQLGMTINIPFCIATYKIIYDYFIWICYGVR